MSRPLRHALVIELCIAAFGLGIALLGEPYWIQLVIGVALSAMLAIAWDILARTGQVSLGSSAFFGLGCYALALLEPVFGIAAGWVGVVTVAVAAAGLLGLLTLRLRRMYFAIATLGFTLSLQVGVLVMPDITGGAGGVTPPQLADGDPAWQLAAITLLLMTAAAVSELLMTPRFRPAFFMIRSNPQLAAASGIPVVRSKLLAFILSGAFAALAGACYGGLYGYVVPGDVFTLNWSVLPLAVTVLGGRDRTIGPLLGAVLLRALEEGARIVIGGTGYQVVYGAVIILAVMFMPTGLAGLLQAALGRGTAGSFLRLRRAAS